MHNVEDDFFKLQKRRICDSMILYVTGKSMAACLMILGNMCLRTSNNNCKVRIDGMIVTSSRCDTNEQLRFRAPNYLMLLS